MIGGISPVHRMDNAGRGAALLRWIFIGGMLAFCLFLAWHTWTVYDLRFQVQDLAVTLETNSQRVLKQQYEYDQTAAAIPQVQAELALVQPEADAGTQAVAELKEERKALRARRNDLALELEAAQAANEAAQESLKQAETERQTLADEVEALRQEAESLALEVEALQEQLKE